MTPRHLEELGLYTCIALLMIVGIVTLSGIAPASTVIKQVIWNLTGLAIIILLNVLEIRDFEYVGKYILWTSIVGLSLVIFFGPEVNGARRWFQFRYFSIQPSEIAKVGFLLSIPYWIAKADKRSVIKSTIVTLLIIVLILLEPDLGTAVMFMALWLILIFASGYFDRFVLWVIGISVASFPIVFFKVLKDYQRERILAFFNPSRYARGAAYNVIQSMRAIGSGGITGKGLGGEMSGKGYVPMAQTDFIFSALGEQWGFLGVVLILGVYTLIFYLLYRAMKLARSSEEELIIMGVTLLFFFHVFENAGMNMGVLPVTGIPLPFVSYGGSSTISFSFLMGVVMRIIALGTRAKHVQTKPFKEKIRKDGLLRFTTRRTEEIPSGAVRRERLR